MSRQSVGSAGKDGKLHAPFTHSQDEPWSRQASRVVMDSQARLSPTQDPEDCQMQPSRQVVWLRSQQEVGVPSQYSLDHRRPFPCKHGVVCSASWPHVGLPSGDDKDFSVFLSQENIKQRAWTRVFASHLRGTCRREISAQSPHRRIS